MWRPGRGRLLQFNNNGADVQVQAVDSPTKSPGTGRGQRLKELRGQALKEGQAHGPGLPTPAPAPIAGKGRGERLKELRAGQGEGGGPGLPTKATTSAAPAPIGGKGLKEERGQHLPETQVGVPGFLTTTPSPFTRRGRGHRLGGPAMPEKEGNGPGLPTVGKAAVAPTDGDVLAAAVQSAPPPKPSAIQAEKKSAKSEPNPFSISFNEMYFRPITTKPPKRKMSLLDLRPTLLTVLGETVNKLREDSEATSEVIAYPGLSKEDCDQVVALIKQEVGQEIKAIAVENIDLLIELELEEEDMPYIIILYKRNEQV